MTTLVDVLLFLVAVGLLVPASVLFVECSLAMLPRRTSPEPAATPRPRVAVLVPAHDEEVVIESTIRSLLPELGPQDRVIVIADNCRDATETVARAAGATVIRREDSSRRGKGYALDFGVRHLSREPPEIVVVVDADCTVHSGALKRLAGQAWLAKRPVQGRYLLFPPKGASPLASVSAFAVLVRNVARPSGLARLGLPCSLMGTGMAFPWSIISVAPLATSALTEDLQLGSDLALAGHPPRFCFEALVTSMLPKGRGASKTQRERWEYGYLTTLVSRGPRLLAGAARRFDLGLLALALDLCVPPLSLLMLAWTGACVVTVALAALGASWMPTILLGLAGGLVFLSIMEAWIAFGRDDVPLSTLLMAPFYVCRKTRMYFGFLGRGPRHWVRTERESDSQSKDR